MSDQTGVKTAYIFSGVDGLDSMTDRLHMLSLPAVIDRISQAQEILNEIAPNFNLLQFISSPDEVFKKDITLQVLAVAVVQIGLFDFFLTLGEKPEYLMGCSLGDIARTYCAGAIDFDVVIKGSWNYHLSAQKIQGVLYHVKSLNEPINEKMLQEIKNEGLHLAVYQTNRHFLVAGTLEQVQAWQQKELPNERYKINPLYDKPLHSIMMNPVTEVMQNLYMHTLKPTDQWKYKMVSSTHLHVLNTKDQLMADMIENFNSTVFWMQALQFSVHELKVNKLINVGPAKTLLLFAERTPLNHPVELVDYFAAPKDETLPLKKSNVV